MLKVYNSNNQIIAGTTVDNNNVKQLTDNDKIFLKTNSLASGFLNGIAVSNLDNSYTRNTNELLQDYGVGVGKIQIPATGEKIVVKSEVPAASQDVLPNSKFLVEFPSLYSSDNVITNTPECNPNPPIYKGSLETIPLCADTWACSNVFRTNAKGYRAFGLVATGLIPRTKHKLYLDTQIWNKMVQLTTSSRETERLFRENSDGHTKNR